MVKKFVLDGAMDWNSLRERSPAAANSKEEFAATPLIADRSNPQSDCSCF
jgi:hypothetical protein